MAKEASLQSKLIKYLKSKGCYVIKTQAGPGVPKGAPDVIALKEGFWLAAEIKASKRSKYQPGQKETIAKLSEWSWCKMVCPENYKAIVEELDEWLA